MLSNLLRAMTRDILLSTPLDNLWHGWKPVPTIRSMKINLGKINALLDSVGLKRRVNTRIQFRKTSGDSMNRYIRHQLIRAERAKKGNPKLFWVIAFTCIRKSISFRTSAYNRVFPQWWHEESLSQVWMKLRRISRLIRTNNDDLQYTRVYIPKGDTFRPLGVPSGEWRVIMHMHNNWLTMYLRPSLEKFNHAYLPRKGALTAWKELIEKSLKARYIYEFDLRQFFPSVDVDKVTTMLQGMKIPKWYTFWLENINRTAPVLPKEEKLDESRVHDKYKVHSQIRQGVYDPTASIYDEINKLGPIAHTLMKEDGYDNIFEWAQAQWAAFDSYGLGGMGTLYKGLPQGLNTSPTLSILTLKDWIEKYRKRRVYATMYADDGLLFSNRPFKPFSQEGAELHKEKSRFLKWDGKWQVESFKFLGIEYLTSSQIIKGATRNGSSLEFDAKRKEVFNLLRELKPDYEKPDLERLTSSNIMGLVFSKLYQGSWDDVSEQMKEWKIHKNSWWGTKAPMKGSPTMSSTAAEVLGNIVRSTI